MPFKGPSICGCGHIIASGAECPCQAKRNAERAARYDAKRPNARDRGYDSAWDKYRRAYLNKHPRCVRCGATARVVDHIKPHKGDQRLFWNKANHQSLCVPCHSVWKQAIERRVAI